MIRMPDYGMSEAVRGQHGVDGGVLTLDPSVDVTNEALPPTVSAQRRIGRGGFATRSEAKIRDESGNPLAGAIGTSELLGDKKP